MREPVSKRVGGTWGMIPEVDSRLPHTHAHTDTYIQIITSCPSLSGPHSTDGAERVKVNDVLESPSVAATSLTTWVFVNSFYTVYQLCFYCSNRFHSQWSLSMHSTFSKYPVKLWWMVVGQFSIKQSPQHPEQALMLGFCCVDVDVPTSPQGSYKPGTVNLRAWLLGSHQHNK